MEKEHGGTGFRQLCLIFPDLSLGLPVVLDERIALDEARAAIEGQLQLLDFPVLGKHVVQVCVPLTRQLSVRDTKRRQTSFKIYPPHSSPRSDPTRKRSSPPPI